MDDPTWIGSDLARAIHQTAVARFGGLSGGVRDETLFEAALARPKNKWYYGDPPPDLFDLAAAYAFAIAKGHPFVDGNKRTAHLLAYTFLDRNGVVHDAPESEVVTTMVAVAEGAMNEDALAGWFRDNSRPAESGKT